METPLISKRDFNKIRKYLPAPGNRKRHSDILVISAIIWVIQKGASWREIPDFYGKWTTIYSRFRRWSKLGIFHKIFSFFASKLKKRCIAMIDSTYVKAHRTACSMAYDRLPRKLGRSHGGITSKLHLLCNSEGKPIDFIITEGQRHDVKAAPELIHRNKMKYLIADKAYGSQALRSMLAQRHIKVCIPPKSNSVFKTDYDKSLYKMRHVIENMFAKIKDWKGLALRTNRNAQSFHSFVCIALFTLFF